MSNRQENGNIHTLKIQQTYWVKDTSEEKMLALGAIQLGRIIEQVDYYDTDLYDLAASEMWLSKMGQEWKLIIGKGASSNSQDAQKENKERSQQEKTHLKSQGSKKHTSKTTNSTTSQKQKEDSIVSQKGNTETVDYDGNSKRALTCYALEEEKEMIAFLSQVLHIPEKTNRMAMEAFLQVAGIQRYATISNVTQETFRLPSDYTVLLKTEGTTTKKTAVVSLNVNIENVTQGFQMLEQLASELDLQLQSV